MASFKREGSLFHLQIDELCWKFLNTTLSKTLQYVHKNLHTLKNSALQANAAGAEVRETRTV